MTEGEIDLKKGLKIIRQRKLFIIGGTLLLMVIAGIIASLVSPVYQASSLLKIGEIYLPPSATRSDLQLLEKVNLLAEIIDSQAPLKKAWERLKADDGIAGKLETRMEAEIFDRGKIPLIEIRCQGSDPGIVLKLTTEVVETILARHSRRYASHQSALKSLVDNLRKNIKTKEEINASQTRHLRKIQKFLSEGRNDMAGFKKELEELEPAEISPVELLFIQSSSLNEGTFIAQLNQVQAGLQVSIEETNEKIVSLQDSIVNMENRIVLSVPTEVVSSPVLPKYPIGPKKKLIVVIAALMGLILTTLYILLREYLRD